MLHWLTRICGHYESALFREDVEVDALGRVRAAPSPTDSGRQEHAVRAIDAGDVDVCLKVEVRPVQWKYS